MPEINAKAPLRQRAMHEFKELVLISLYLYVTLGAVIMIKAAVLQAEGIKFSPWGLAIVKAVVLAKFMLIGEAMKIGEHTTRPLIWPTLQKAFALLALLIILTIIEEVVVGLFHGRSIAASLNELGGPRLEETLAGFVVMLLVLIPYCAFRVLDGARSAKAGWHGCSLSTGSQWSADKGILDLFLTVLTATIQKRGPPAVRTYKRAGGTVAPNGPAMVGPHSQGSAHKPRNSRSEHQAAPCFGLGTRSTAAPWRCG